MGPGGQTLRPGNGPLVSVVLATRNRRALLQRSLDSVLGQTFQDLELIVVNDGSSDGTADLLARYAQGDARLRVLENPRSLGSNPSRNRGIRAARGFYLAGLDDDDYFLPQRLERLLRAYDPAYAFVTSNNRLVYDDGEEGRTDMPAVITLKAMAGENLVMNQVLAERERVIRAGLFDTELSACQDYDLWMRLMLAYGDAKAIPEVTQVVNLESRRRRISTDDRVAFRGYFRFYRKYKHLMTPGDRRKHLYRIHDVSGRRMSDRVRWILSPAGEREGHFLRYAFARLGKEHYRMFIDFAADLGRIQGDQPYVLYGYGTIGRFIAGVLGRQIVAVMDRKLLEQGVSVVDGLPVIPAEGLADYPRAKILLSVSLHRDMIEPQLRPLGREIVCLPDLRLPWDK